MLWPHPLAGTPRRVLKVLSIHLDLGLVRENRMVPSHLLPSPVTTASCLYMIRKQQLQYQWGNHQQRGNNTDMLSHYGGICQRKNYYNFCYKLFCKFHKICKNWHFKGWDHLNLFKIWGPWDSAKESLFLYLAFICVGLVFFSSLFIIHRSQLAIFGLWPLNPVLPINFSFVSGSRYKFSESQFFFFYQIMQQSWPVSKSWQKSLWYLESTLKCFFWHRLVPQSLQSTSLKDTFLIMLSSLHIHPKHTHTHTSFLHATVMSHITKAKLPWFSPCRTFIKIHASHLRPLESFSSKTAALVCHMPIMSFYMRDIPVRAGITRAHLPALEVTWPWHVCTGD